jgi:hypothetical protein
MKDKLKNELIELEEEFYIQLVKVKEMETNVKHNFNNIKTLLNNLSNSNAECLPKILDLISDIKKNVEILKDTYEEQEVFVDYDEAVSKYLVRNYERAL